MSEFRPKARQTGLVVQEIMDEVLVYDQLHFRAHYLNRIAAAVWKQCDAAPPPRRSRRA